MGTDGSLELVEEAARKGRKPNPERAYALILYGAMHPDAGLEAKKDWSRAASDFERGCLLAGLLSQPQRLAGPDWAKLVAKSKASGLREVYEIAAMLRGETWPEAPENAALLAARVLTTHIPGVSGISPPALEGADGFAFPPLWAVGARHVPPRTVEDLKGQALVDERIALVLSIYEVEAEYRQELFDHFRTRTVGSMEAGWLWGAAGDLRLEFPAPEGEHLDNAYVAGLLRLGLQDFDAAVAAALPHLPQARHSFNAKLPMQKRWPAAVVLALAGQAEDTETLKKVFLAASGSERQRLQPIWKFTNRSLGSTRISWLNRWSRELGAGWVGFLDKEGPRWVAYQLVGGTIAAEWREEISAAYPQLSQVPRDYADDAVLYHDLAVLLLDGVYHWGLSQQ